MNYPARIIEVFGSEGITQLLNRTKNYFYPNFSYAKTSKTNPKIIDSVILADEIELLYLRYTILKDVVDQFVVVEGNRWFSGENKPYHKEEFFSKYNVDESKFLWVEFESPEELRRNKAEDYSRKILTNTLENLNLDRGDQILIQDVDEIANPQKILQFIGMSGTKIFCQDMHVISFELRRKSRYSWGGTLMIDYAGLEYIPDLYKKFRFHNLKNEKLKVCIFKLSCGRLEKIMFVNEGGWHFSSFGSVNDIVRKFKHRSHSFHKSEIIKNFEKRDLIEQHNVIDNEKYEFVELNQIGITDNVFTEMPEKFFINQG